MDAERPGTQNSSITQRRDIQVCSLALQREVASDVGIRVHNEVRNVRDAVSSGGGSHIDFFPNESTRIHLEAWSA